jgi:hypothetical protein
MGPATPEDAMRLVGKFIDLPEGTTSVTMSVSSAKPASLTITVAPTPKQVHDIAAAIRAMSVEPVVEAVSDSTDEQADA